MLERDILISPWVEPQFRPFNEHYFKANYAFQITDLFIRTARLDEGILIVMLKANIFGLLFLLLQQEFRGTQYVAPNTGDEPIKHSPIDFEFLAMICEHGLRKYYPPVPRDDLYSISVQRVILSQAFNVVLRCEKPTGEADKLYQTSDFDMD
ncbi:hypothetical protein BDZ94DRAFT_1305841 [Collybia nuda]|uniref:Uncharacterized protein n=1 Tax=Collybia nuda TaxID=64659 RepID=A0A9P5YE50_9AGAR|nr:hypothetical protein BDZ94DRAFT_1305841 [Collybia nuda]